LFFLAGVSSAFDRASWKDFGDKMPLWGVIAVCVIFGGLLGWISFYIGAFFISWTGKLLKGAGNTMSIFRMGAYAMIPSVVALILLIPQMAVCGNGLFQSDWDITEEVGLFGNILF